MRRCAAASRMASGRVLVGGQSHTAAFYDFTGAWSHYAANITGCVALPSGHYPAEQVPDLVYSELSAFLKA